ncbi:flagellar hook capping protein [Candidatus Gottesmanbacteria bacterium]|nr:flagellar hook capping protein [Candidatus Gottesmanbacteria bacterium]
MNTGNVGLVTTATTQDGSHHVGKVLDKDAFLRLLVTQLRYQNPVNPLGNEQFISQTAEFSALEQLQELSKSARTLIELQKLTNNLGLFNLIGKNVVIRTSRGTFSGVIDSINLENIPYLSIGDTNILLSEIKEISLRSQNKEEVLTNE